MVVIVGPAGSGKTTLAKRLARVAPRPVLVVDPHHQWNPQDGLIGSRQAKVVNLWSDVDPDRINIWRPAPGDDDRLVFWGIRQGYFRHGAIQTLILDEAVYHHQGKGLAYPELLEVARYHRQLGLCLIALSQRPAGLDRDFTANARYLIAFKCHEPRDKAFLRDMGIEPDELDNLPRFGYIEKRLY